jgi:hypothetical protein
VKDGKPLHVGDEIEIICDFDSPITREKVTLETMLHLDLGLA